MSLMKYEGKTVQIIDINGHSYEGKITDYVFPDDDDSGLESIILACKKRHLAGNSIGFWEKDIKHISVV